MSNSLSLSLSSFSDFFPPLSQDLDTVLAAVGIPFPWPPPQMSFSDDLFALDHISISDFSMFNFFTGGVAPR